MLIGDQIDLGWRFDPSEARDPHGKWTKSGAGYVAPDPSRLVLAKAPKNSPWPVYMAPTDHPFFKAHPVSAANVVASYDASTESERAQGMRWYADAGTLAKAIAHGDQTKGAGVLAAYSPQTAWPVNMFNAAKAIELNRALGPGDGMITHAMQNNAQEALDGVPIDKNYGRNSAPKIRDFAKLIENGGDSPDDQLGRVVIDRHAMSVAMGTRLEKKEADKAPIGTNRYYQHVADTYRLAALEVSKRGTPITPHQIQAVTWLHQQAANEAQDKGGAAGHGGKGAGKGRQQMIANAWKKWDTEAQGEGFPVNYGTTALSNEDVEWIELGWHFNPAEPRNLHGEWASSDIAQAMSLPGAHLMPSRTDQALIAFGDPATADHVITYVPGMGSDKGVAGEAQRALSLKNAADVQGNGSTAAVLWMGYHPPENLHEAVRKNRAEGAKGDLAGFQRQLRAANPRGHLTVLGHSYGSVVASEAAKTGTMPADDLVLVGSPGTTARHARELGPAGHVWAGANSMDPIARASELLSPDFSGSPARQEFGANVFRADVPGGVFPGWDHPAAHSSYFQPHSEAMPNMAAIAAGEYGRVLSPGMRQPVMAANDTQALDLTGGWHDAWRHEMRGPHGEWVKGERTEQGLGSLLRKAATPFVGPAPKGEGYPGEFADKIIKFWKNEDNPQAKQELNLAGAEWGSSTSTEHNHPATALHLRNAARLTPDGNKATQYNELARDIETAGQTDAELRKNVTDEATPASRIVPALLGSQHEIWNGKVQIYSVAEKPKVLAELEWDGSLNVQDQVAAALGDARAHPELPVKNPDAFEVLEHEMIHGVVQEGTERDNERAYQDYATAQIEEGFTELGAIHHAPEFLDKMGLGSRESGQWAGHTVHEMAVQMQDPTEIANGNAWRHYGSQTKDAQDWVQQVAKEEGVPDMRLGTPGHDRVVALADEINRQGAAGKIQVMARQLAVAMSKDSPMRNNHQAMADLTATIQKSIHDQWNTDAPEGAANAAFASARHTAVQKVQEKEREMMERAA